MTIAELEQIEQEIIKGRHETIENINNATQNRFFTKEEKKEIKSNTVAIFENSLRMIKEQKQKLRGEI